MDDTEPTKLGFKALSPDNWLHVDRTWAGIVMSTSHSDPSRAWVTDVLARRLPYTAPLPVVRLFEVARGAFVYGLMFYPLMAIGFEQLARLLETAVAYKCKELGAPPGVKGFRRSVEWLIGRGIISTDRQDQWNYLVHLRNVTSHPEDQNIYPPGWILEFIDTTADLIEGLFATMPHNSNNE